MTLNSLTFDCTYRPVVALTVCSVCTLVVPSYGASITTPGDAPLVGIDTAGMEVCHGHALYVDLGPCDLGHPECEDHLHSRAYHSADCSCGRTEADCTEE